MYHKQNIGLTLAQAKRLAQAVASGKPLTFTKYERTGDTPIYLTECQKNKLDGPLRIGVKQLEHIRKQGGFLGSLLKLIGPALKVAGPAIKTIGKIAGPAAATGAITAAANYGTRKALKGKRGRGLQLKRGKGLRLKHYKGGNVTIELTLTPEEVNALHDKKDGGFLGVLASLAASLLPTLLGNGLSSTEMTTAKDIIKRVGRHQLNKKNAQQELDLIAQKYGSGLLGKLFGLPGNKVPVLGDIPLLNVLF